ARLRARPPAGGARRRRSPHAVQDGGAARRAGRRRDAHRSGQPAGGRQRDRSLRARTGAFGTLRELLLSLREDRAETDPSAADGRLVGRTYAIPFDRVWTSAVA